LGRIPHEQGDLRAAMACYEESLAHARAVGDPWLIAGALHFMGWAALAAHEHAQARARFEESLAIREAAGDQLGRAQSLEGLAALAMDQADYTAARALTEQRLATEQGLGNRLGIAASLRTLGHIAAAEGKGTEAAVRLEASLAHYQHAGNTLGQRFTLADLRRLALARGDDAAAQAFEHAQAALQRAEGARQDQPPTGLTSREAEVLRLVALGLTNAEVAERLIVSPFTVNAHLRAIFGKLGVTSRSAATRYAVDHHLI
jgi:DNA-binding CsgD family transcriptional regulator